MIAYKDNFATLINGDCYEWLQPENGLYYDAVVTDPPYGTGGRKRTFSGQGSNPSGDIIKEAWDDGNVDWVRLIPSHIPIITFFATQNLSKLLNVANETGRTKHRALYLRKPDPMPSYSGRIRWSVEPIWVLSEDGFQLLGGDDVLDASTPRRGRDRDATGHPYEKPVEVMQWILGKFSAGRILDPFMGSGTTIRAAKDMGIPSIGIEINPDYCLMAVDRVKQEPLWPRNPTR